jgi:EcsC protein family
MQGARVTPKSRRTKLWAAGDQPDAGALRTETVDEIGNRSEHSRSQSAQKFYHRGIDFRRLLLLGPVAAARQNDGLAQFRHKIGKVWQEPIHTREIHHKISVASDVERRYVNVQSSERRYASRFGVVVTQKLAVQAVPFIGAVGGAAVNYAFIDHFQEVARAHFIVRGLERRYGKDTVRAAYDRLSSHASAAA